MELSHGTQKFVKLNVGGKVFVTSSQTLLSAPESFLARIVSGSIPSTEDGNGAIFIDRCPQLFEKILTYLRTKRIRLGTIDIDDMLNEADYFGIQSLIDRLRVCSQLRRSTCGNISFSGHIPPPKDWNSDASSVVSPGIDLRVIAICAADKWIAVAYDFGVSCYSTRQFSGEAWPLHHASWHRVTKDTPKLLALKSLKQSTRDERWEQLLLACATESNQLYIWQQSLESDPPVAAAVNDAPEITSVGVFDLFPVVDALFFAGRRQVIALNYDGFFAIWHYSRNFQTQEAEKITSYDESGSMLFFGHESGFIRYFNVENLPVRMRDNKIILTDCYRDNDKDSITALDVRISSNSLMSDFSGDQFYFEIAYGTSSGRVKLITEHAEMIGHGPQLLFSFAVHRSPVTRVLLSEQYLVSNCSHLNHVRTWQISRFRGLLSKNPLPIPHASFKMIQLEPKHNTSSYLSANFMGPHMLSDSEIWFIQKITPAATELFVISAFTGECLHKISSVDDSPITSYTVIEEWCRAGAPTQYVFTGHENGTVQVWNLAALRVPVSNSLEPQLVAKMDRFGDLRDMVQNKEHCTSSKKVNSNSNVIVDQKPSVDDILKMLDNYDISDTSLLF